MADDNSNLVPAQPLARRALSPQSRELLARILIGEDGPAGGASRTAAPAPMPRPVQISTGPDPSVPWANGQGPSGATPVAPRPAAPIGTPAGAAPPSFPQAGGAAAFAPVPAPTAAGSQAWPPGLDPRSPAGQLALRLAAAHAVQRAPR